MLKSSECKIDGFWYYFDENGQFVAGRWINHHNADYYYDDQGHMYYGYGRKVINYYLNKEMAKGNRREKSMVSGTILMKMVKWQRMVTAQ